MENTGRKRLEDGWIHSWNMQSNALWFLLSEGTLGWLAKWYPSTWSSYAKGLPILYFNTTTCLLNITWVLFWKVLVTINITHTKIANGSWIWNWCSIIAQILNVKLSIFYKWETCTDILSFEDWNNFHHFLESKHGCLLEVSSHHKDSFFLSKNLAEMKLWYFDFNLELEPPELDNHCNKDGVLPSSFAWGASYVAWLFHFPPWKIQVTL